MASTQQPTSCSSVGTLLDSCRNTSFEDESADSTSTDTSSQDSSDGLDAVEAQKYLESILFSSRTDHKPHDQPYTPQKHSTTAPFKGPHFRPPPTPDTTPSKKPTFKRLYGGAAISRPSHLPLTPDNTPAKASFKRPCPAVEHDYEDDNEDEEKDDEPFLVKTPSEKRSRPSPSSSTSTTTTTAATPLSTSSLTSTTTNRTPNPNRTHQLSRSSSTPKFSIAHRSPSSPQSTKNHQREKVSKLEMERVRESVMQQVDWNRVALDVAANRSGRVYRRAVRDVLGETVEELGR